MALRFLLRFPAFSQKEQNRPFFAFPWRFQKILEALRAKHSYTARKQNHFPSPPWGMKPGKFLLWQEEKEEEAVRGGN